MDKEIWAPIEGYEGMYEVSDLGRVRSWRVGAYRKDKPKYLKGYITDGGIRQVLLTGPEKKHSAFAVQDLVAQAFLGPQPEFFHLINIDGNLLNNKVSNLKYNNVKNIKSSYTYFSTLDKKWFCSVRHFGKPAYVVSHKDKEFVTAAYHRIKHTISVDGEEFDRISTELQEQAKYKSTYAYKSKNGTWTGMAPGNNYVGRFKTEKEAIQAVKHFQKTGQLKHRDSECVWKPISGFDGRYEISERGDVRAIGRKTPVNIKVYHERFKGSVVRLIPEGGGRFTRRVPVSVPKLMLETFVGPCPDGYKIYFKDRNMENCKLNNLEYTNTEDKSKGTKSSKYCGVSYSKSEGVWLARGKGTYLGRFETEDLADFAVRYFKKHGRRIPAANRKESKMTKELVKEEVQTPKIERARQYLHSTFNQYTAVTLDDLEAIAPSGINRSIMGSARNSVGLYGFKYQFIDGTEKWVYSKVPKDALIQMCNEGRASLKTVEEPPAPLSRDSNQQLLQTIRDHPILSKVFEILQWAYVGCHAYIYDARITTSMGVTSICCVYRGTIKELNELQVVLDIESTEGVHPQTYPLSSIFRTYQEAEMLAVDVLRRLVYERSAALDNHKVNS